MNFHCLYFLFQEIIATLREVTRFDPFYKEQVHLLAEQVDFNNPAELADLVAAIASSREGAQKVLEELDVAKRLRMALEHLKSELETNKIRAKLAKEVEKNFAETQRKYFLREQLNIIQKGKSVIIIFLDFTDQSLVFFSELAIIQSGFVFIFSFSS